MHKTLKGFHKTGATETVDTDAYFLGRALDLAWMGAGRTRTNPMVGAVVVRDGRVVGEGFHAAYGLDHAETVALDRAGEDARGATLFVTLEPCTHEGKTPPCTDRIIESGPARVVVCTLDPDRRMDGKGVEQLRAAGIRVDVGHCIGRAVALNLPYFKRMLDMGPAVTLKMAVTLDGRIAARTGSRDRVSGAPAQELVHRLRASRDAVVVGINTLLVDAPQLDVRRLEHADTPRPVVLDSSLRFPPEYPWLAGGREPIVLAREGADAAKRAALESVGAAVESCGGTDDGICPHKAVATLSRHGISSVLVEGGAAVFSSFLENDCWDDLHMIVAPHAFGPEGVAAADRSIDHEALGAVAVEAAPVGDDVHITYLSRKTLEAIAARVT